MQNNRKEDGSVDMGRCGYALPHETIWAYGLRTYVVLVAYGLPGPTGHNKVLACVGDEGAGSTLEAFILTVKSIGIRDVQVWISQPNVTVADQDDKQWQEDIAALYGHLEPRQVTGQDIELHKAWNKRVIKMKNVLISLYCEQHLAKPEIFARPNTTRQTQNPLSLVRATDSPGGHIWAEGVSGLYWMAMIPNQLPDDRAANQYLEQVDERQEDGSRSNGSGSKDGFHPGTASNSFGSGRGESSSQSRPISSAPPHESGNGTARNSKRKVSPGPSTNSRTPKRQRMAYRNGLVGVPPPKPPGYDTCGRVFDVCFETPPPGYDTSGSASNGSSQVQRRR